ncbi:MAG: hypothetical protein [Caudoviricetes sp.]|nr:MAG: hypothetical protein [Caudoviricetes sp.]
MRRSKKKYVVFNLLNVVTIVVGLILLICSLVKCVLMMSLPALFLILVALLNFKEPDTVNNPDDRFQNNKFIDD